ncbi:MAG: DegV family protein [Solirubrobacterales bacterium]
MNGGNGGGVALVTDSTASLTAEDRERLDVDVVNLYTIVDENQQREDEIEDLAVFYREVIESPTPSKTSQPSIGDFIDVYSPLLEQGKEVISVHLSAAISGTFEAARQAADQLEAEGRGGERIHLVDSRATAGALALTVLATSNALREGLGVQGAIERAEAIAETQQNWILVETLDYLQKGGRIGGAQACIGGALKIKPIITLDETVYPIERVRTMSKGIQRIKDIATEKAADGTEYVWLAQHIQAPERMEELADHCREVFGTEGIFMNEMSTILGIHGGPGLLALGIAPAEHVGTGR